MKLYLREYWAWGKEYYVYKNLADAIRERWTARLYEIDLKRNENICCKSLYETIYYIDSDWELNHRCREWDDHYAFIIKDWEDICNITIEEMERRVEKFQKRLKKFTELDKMKYEIESQIKDLQKQLDELN